MASDDGAKLVAGCVVVVAAVVCVAAVTAGVSCLLALGVCYVAETLFARPLPYWPTVVMVALVLFAVSAIQGVLTVKVKKVD